MKRALFTVSIVAVLVVLVSPVRSAERQAEVAAAIAANGDGINRILNSENQGRGVSVKPLPIVDDLAFLRRVYVDLIGRIPTQTEVAAFKSLPQIGRRTTIVDQLIANERFADTWTVFFADMLRLRSNADGGRAALAYVHQSIQDEVPYDTLAQRLISANGKAGATPEVGFILGDNADPMALAGATSQVFMGVRIACAQCHDHPFDVWTQKDFYAYAAFFGKTRRVETRFTNTVYTTESNQTTIFWPPEDPENETAERKPMEPRFPFDVKKQSGKHITRLASLRKRQTASRDQAKTKTPETSVDDLLASLDGKVEKATRNAKPDRMSVVNETRRDARDLNVQAGIAGQSALRTQLAKMITDPHNHYFSQCFVNRVWAHLVGRGFVEPIDDFSDENTPSHPETLEFLANEFVAHGYDLKTLVRMIVTSDAYQRSHAYGIDKTKQTELEESFLATPMRRMLSEVIYDSIVTAGHLFDVKHPAGENLKTVWSQTRVPKPRTGDAEGDVLPSQSLASAAGEQMNGSMQAMKRDPAGPNYNLENAIELDFDQLLKGEKTKAMANVERMAVMSKEEIEANRMQEQMQRRRQGGDFIDRFVKTTTDDNPQFGTSLRMASPAPPEHFLRVFGQTDRTQLGEHRDHNPSMRQALMMLNGRLTHEASRVGTLEPIHKLLVGEKANVENAVRMAYLEILTRKPSTAEITDAKIIIDEADGPLAGMADLRWLLLNCNEFRFLP